MRRLVMGIALASLFVGGCTSTTTPSPSPVTPSAPPPSLPPASSAPAASTAPPTATPAPSLSLERPATTDPREVAVSVVPEVGVDGGRITVTVVSITDELIDELVLRWPTDLGETLLLAPFVPSEDRLREGQPLVQPWTKWVIGPGEQGEPEGTTSLGYGPLLPGATLEIPIFATRVAAGPVAFDLQILAGADLLTLEAGTPAVIRVEVP